MRLFSRRPTHGDEAPILDVPARSGPGCCPKKLTPKNDVHRRGFRLPAGGRTKSPDNCYICGVEHYLDNSIQFVPGVGEARAKLLERELGIRTMRDLLWYFPFRYIDRTRIYRIAEIRDGEATLVQFRGRVTGVNYAGAGRKRRFTAVVSDGSSQAELVWFQGIKWIEKRIEVGREYLVFGRPSFFKGELSLIHPEIETVEKAFSRKAASGMQGVYSTTERLASVLGAKGFYLLVCNLWTVAGERIEEYLPETLRTRHGLMPLREALYNLHFPQSAELLRQAQYRLKFDELLGVQLGIQSRRTERLAKLGGFLFPRVGGVFRTFYEQKLPFPLTGAQKRVVREIRQDTVSGYQMNRLLQGDVGSGKTLVALLSMLLAVDNDFQACLMAPTEILARQHYATFVRMLEGLDVRVAVLTGATRARERRQILAGLADGTIHLLVGTHALLEEKVQFHNLGFVVIDEQHRFGVEQRARLWTKNAQPPHILVMTATPIPRTLALIIYGDLDVSIIDELPPGRQKVDTFAVGESYRQRLNGFIRKQVAEGHQVFIVCPLVAEDDQLPDERKAVTAYAQKLQNEVFPDLRISVLHGRMKSREKESVMAAFAAGESDILVSTTVVEVGVDVPNANLMVVENAERFGLSQLHQLRGRVGRGSAKSWCILLSDSGSDDTRRRLKVLTETNDGFRISEEDLKLRGPGDFFGQRQHGLPTLKAADLSCDVQLLDEAQSAARALLTQDPQLAAPAHAPLLRRIRRLFAASEGGLN